MTKENYIDEVIAYIARVDKTRRAHPRVIEAALTNAINSVWSMIYQEAPHDVSLFTQTYENVSVTGDKTYLTSNYTEGAEPIDMVNLPRIGGGVMAIRPTNDIDVMFFPMSVRDAMFQERLESHSYTTDVGYVVRGNEIQYLGIPNEVAEVDVDIVRSFAEYDYTEIFYMPWRQEDIIGMVLQKLGIVAPVNLKNNNSDEHSAG